MWSILLLWVTVLVVCSCLESITTAICLSRYYLCRLLYLLPCIWKSNRGGRRLASFSSQGSRGLRGKLFVPRPYQYWLGPLDITTQHYLQKSHAPLLVNSCTVDVQFPLEAQEQADNILGDGKFAPGYKRIYFEGCTHGFAVRGDMSDPKTKAGKEGSFKATVEWLFKYF